MFAAIWIRRTRHQGTWLTMQLVNGSVDRCASSVWFVAVALVQQWVAFDAAAACVLHTLRQDKLCLLLGSTQCACTALWSWVVWVRAPRLAFSVQ